jgi:Domain of unknown function (DUF3425)
LREAKTNADDTQSENHCHGVLESRSFQSISLDAFDLTGVDLTMPSSLSPSSSSYLSSIGQAPTLSYELPYHITVLSALIINGEVLGLSCCTAVPAKSSPASLDVPLSLHPTPTQLLTVHSTGIDRFPFPKMRDNLINMSGIIDEEEFGRDLFMMPSFSITPGGAPWDARAWKIEKGHFADKWGFLFY